MTSGAVALVFFVLVMLGLPLFAAWVSGTGRWERWGAATRAWKGRHPVLSRALVALAFAPPTFMMLLVANENWREGHRVPAVVNLMQAFTWAVLYPLIIRRAARWGERNNR